MLLGIEVLQVKSFENVVAGNLAPLTYKALFDSLHGEIEVFLREKFPAFAESKCTDMRTDQLKDLFFAEDDLLVVEKQSHDFFALMTVVELDQQTPKQLFFRVSEGFLKESVIDLIKFGNVILFAHHFFDDFEDW